MKHLKTYESFETDPETHALRLRLRKDNTNLENDYLDKISVGVSSDLDEVSKKWINIVMFGSSLIDSIGLDKKDPLVTEFKYRIVEGEDPIEVVNDVYKRLPKNDRIEFIMNRINETS